MGAPLSGGILLPVLLFPFAVALFLRAARAVVAGAAAGMVVLAGVSVLSAGSRGVVAEGAGDLARLELEGVELYGTAGFG